MATKPMRMGIARDRLGSYVLPLTLLATLPLILAVVALFARRPQRETDDKGPTTKETRTWG